MESYVVSVICILLNLRVLDLNNEDRWIRFNSQLTVIMLGIFALFPIWSITLMCCKFDQLKNKGFKSRFGALYKGYSKDSRKMLIWWGAEYLRKVLLGLTMVATQKMLWLQLNVILLSSISLVIIAGHFPS